ncbi:craniofacial development protein 2-like [Elysia marginata]|uniref:Craniofacial development protein 2-like n=1 Tax=Elysia marginata TaxID=1093978 RepID=A0AAV4IFH2_9GAST|nr:craniofacial development protein 2-like [Elysia marginata]
MSAPSSSYRNKIRTCNVRAHNEPGALSCVMQEMEDLKLDVLGISETPWTGAGDFRTQTLKIQNTHRVIHLGGEEHRKSVAFILSEKASKSIKFFYLHSERIILLKLKEGHHDTMILQIYAYI